MPTYQYACTDCGHRFEQVQAFSDASLTDCPVCGGKLRKVYGSVGVVFKGSGFYRTDSRSGAAGAVANGSEKSEKSDSPASPDAGKTAAKETSTSTAKSGELVEFVQFVGFVEFVGIVGIVQQRIEQFLVEQTGGGGKSST